MLIASEPPPGWSQPVYTGMRESATFYGVPFVFGALLAITMLFCLLWYYPLIPVGLLLWGVVALGTTLLGASWLTLLWRHYAYCRHYEG